MKKLKKKDLEDAKEFAIEKGRKAQSIEIAKNLLKINVNTIEQIADVTNLSLLFTAKMRDNS